MIDTNHGKRFYNSLNREQKLAFESIISDLEIVQELREEIRTRQKDIIDKIMIEFEAITKLKRKDLISRSRKAELVMMRTCLSVWLHTYTGLSIEAIGEVIGRDHSTVVHYKNVVHPMYKRTSGLYRMTYSRLHEAGIKIIRQTEIQNQIKEEDYERPKG